MDEKMRISIPLPVALAICLLAALALPDAGAGLCSRAPDADSVTTEVGDTRIVFSPLDEFARMILTVTGPFEYVFVQEVGTNDDAVFDLDPPETVDGCYTWEVRGFPILSAEILEILDGARESGNYSGVRELMRVGALPDQARTQTGGFQVIEGVIVLGGEPEEGRSLAAISLPGAGGLPAKGPTCGGDVPFKDYVINNDLIVDGSACVGFSCSNGWAFDYTTIGMSEHNTRIKFDDTSNTYSYPNNDWQLLANASSNGGTEKFSIIDCGDNDSQGACSGSTVFTVEAGADSHSLYVDDAGRVGFGTSTPYVELHVVDGDTPTLRLAQDGSSGFTSQTWDVAGNESNFFVRDSTNGSKLPFRIIPGAPTSSIYINSDGYVGMGTSSPNANLHVHEASSGNQTLLELRNNGRPRIVLEDTSVGGINEDWMFGIIGGGSFGINALGDGTAELELQTDGDLIITGSYTPDYVFESDYPLMPLAELQEFIDENKHLPNVPSNDEVATTRKINLNEFQMRLLEKIEELTLYTLEQQKIIDAQQEVIEKFQAHLEAEQP